MAKTALNAVNAVLKEVKIIKGDSSALTSFTDSARQPFIDLALQKWNETIDKLYALSNRQRPNGTASATITLSTSTRAYALNSSLTRIYWPLQDTTNGNYIYEYEGGYEKLIEDQPIPANYTSLPNYGAIRPTDGYLYLDTSPASTYNGRSYTYQYDTDLEMTAITDTVPFENVVYRALIPAVAEKWREIQYGRFNEAKYNDAMSQAVKYLTKTHSKDSWRPKQPRYNNTDPLNA